MLFEHNELGMKSLTALHAASIVPVWQLIFPPSPHTPPHPFMYQRSNTARHLCSVAACTVAEEDEEAQGTLTCHPHPTPPRPFMTCEHTLAKTCVLRARFSVRWQKHVYIHMCTCYISLLLSLHNASVSAFSSSWFIAFPTFAKNPLSVSDSPQIEYG